MPVSSSIRVKLDLSNLAFQMLKRLCPPDEWLSEEELRDLLDAHDLNGEDTLHDVAVNAWCTKADRCRIAADLEASLIRGRAWEALRALDEHYAGFAHNCLRMAELIREEGSGR